jgi:hypothetical protein
LVPLRGKNHSAVPWGGCAGTGSRVPSVGILKVLAPL